MATETRAANLLARTRAFALYAIRVYSRLPRHTVAQVLGKQLLRSATSVGAQYREAQHAKSISDFVSKTEGALQELQETRYWLDLIRESGIDKSRPVSDLQTEATELVAIFISITRKAKENKKRAGR